MHLSILVPLFNESRTLERSVNELRAFLQDRSIHGEIILIDDGSTDETRGIMEVLAEDHVEIQCAHHAVNRGKGAAIKTGAQLARGRYIGFLDADLSTKPNVFDLALPLLTHADLVFASRAHPKSTISVQQPLYRVLSGKLFNAYVRRLLHLPYRDTQCGFKVFHRSLLPLVAEIQADGWAFDVELLYGARRRGLALQAIPVDWRHHGESRVALSDAFTIFHELKRIKKCTTVPPDARQTHE